MVIVVKAIQDSLIKKQVKDQWLFPLPLGNGLHRNLQSFAKSVIFCIAHTDHSENIEKTISTQISSLFLTARLRECECVCKAEQPKNFAKYFQQTWGAERV